MGWHISTTDIPRINCFETAERFWNAAKPWKNELTSWRPLAGRRARHKRIVRINDGDGYQLVLFSTPVVTYHKNGDVELQTYDSTSTQSFAYMVRPTGAVVSSAQGRMYWGFSSQAGYRYVRQGNEPLILKATGDNQYNLLTKPAEDFEWELNRSAAAVVRKKLSHYKRWYDITARLQGLRGTNFCYDPHTGLRRILADPENPENFNIGLGPAQGRYRLAYELTGARYKVPAPYDRLPRIQK